MSNYTLDPIKNHGVSKKLALRQLGLFVQVAPKVGIVKPRDGLRSIVDSLKTIRRWGGFETGALVNSARKYPNRLAIVDDLGQLTYAELFGETVRFAYAMQARGIVEGSNLAVLALNSRAAIIPLCARQLLGYNIFMINANSSGAQVQRIMEYHDTSTLVVDSDFVDRLTEETIANSDIIIGFEVDGAEVSAELPRMMDLIAEATLPGGSVERAVENLPKSPKWGAHVVMTSGTTGMPKGVVRRAKASLQSSAPVFASVPWRRHMTVLLTGVLFHFYGWGNLVLALHTGSTVVTQRKYDAAAVVKVMQDQGVNAWISAASRLRAMCSYLDEHGIERIDGLEFIMSSGSPLTPYEVHEIHAKFGNVLHNLYGSTESAAIAISTARELVADPALSGTIRPGTAVRIVDSAGNDVSDGEVGEIYVGDYTMFDGYTDPDIEIPLLDGLLRMGDKGYRVGDKLYVKGRADDLVITQYGEKIFPNEVEDSLLYDERVKDVCVHGVEDNEFGQALRCYVIREEGLSKDDLSADDVAGLVRERLSDAHVPRDIYFVQKFPRNPMGKVIRPELPGRSTVA
ncbi:MAG: AMP-binding protein [Corynebacterium sp.]|nr:AMP-binding protein [Corynebacterium sp.]